MSHDHYNFVVDYFYSLFSDKDHVFHGKHLNTYRINIRDVRLAVAELMFESPDDIDKYLDTYVHETIVSRCIKLVSKQEKHVIQKVIDMLIDYQDYFCHQSQEFKSVMSLQDHPLLPDFVHLKLEIYMLHPTNQRISWTQVLHRLGQRWDQNNIHILTDIVNGI